MGFGKRLNEGIGFGNTGGTRKAYEQFEKYMSYLNPLAERAQRFTDTSFDNPFTNQISGGFGEALNYARSSAGQALHRIQQVRNQAGNLSGLARNNALSSTLGARQASVQAARLAGGGRGGLAFGGGAGAIASRGAQQAATQQNAALAQAQLGAEQSRLGLLGQMAGLESQVRGQSAGLYGQLVGAQSQALAQQSQLFDAHKFGLMDRRLQTLLAPYQLGGNLANTGLAAGIRGENDAQKRRSDMSMQTFRSPI